MEKTQIKNLTRKILKVIMWVFLVLVLLFVALYIFRFSKYVKTKKVDNQIAIVHSTKIEIEDVLGENLPNDPGEEGDKTLQGIDANTNGVRDDVELAIFNKYPKSAKTRAVLLQYALALQMETIQSVLSEEIATEIVREEGRADVCLSDVLVPRENKESFRTLEDLEKIDEFINFIEEIQFNTIERKNARDDFYKKVRSYSDLDKEECDIDLSKLTN